MVLMNCPECGSKVSDKARNCPACGLNIFWNVAPEHGTRIWQMLVGWVIAFFAGLVAHEVAGIGIHAAAILTFGATAVINLYLFPLANRACSTIESSQLPQEIQDDETRS